MNNQDDWCSLRVEPALDGGDFVFTHNDFLVGGGSHVDAHLTKEIGGEFLHGSGTLPMAFTLSTSGITGMEGSSLPAFSWALTVIAAAIATNIILIFFIIERCLSLLLSLI